MFQPKRNTPASLQDLRLAAFQMHHRLRRREAFLAFQQPYTSTRRSAIVASRSTDLHIARLTCPFKIFDSFFRSCARRVTSSQLRQRLILYLEVAEIHRRVIESHGPALLFNRVKGSSFPVVTNLFGTPKRIELAFGSKPQQLVKQIVHFAETLLPPEILQALGEPQPGVGSSEAGDE